MDFLNQGFRRLTKSGQPTSPAAPPTSRSAEKPPQKFNPDIPQENVIFWGTKRASGRSFTQKLRTFFWFYPDLTSIFMHRFRPLSFLVLYSFIFFLGWRTITYAAQNPQSALNLPPEQTLNEGVVGSISSIDPLYITQNQTERDLQALIFSKLTRIGPDGNPQPEIAETWAISEDGKSYTFFLREDVYWHDGEHLTADDVIFTFETVQALNNEDSYSSEFENITFSKIDDFTVTMTLPETNPTLTETLAFPIIPKHILEDIAPSEIKFSSFKSFPVGTGPFVITENNGDHIYLERNEYYFKGMPELEEIHYIFYPTEEDAVDALKRFEIHTLTQASGDAIDEMKPYQAYNTNYFTLQLRRKLIYFNLRNTGAASSAAVRQALSSATDKELLLSNLSAGGVVSDGPIHPSSWAYSTETDRFGYDIARAQQLFEQDGWIYDDPENTKGTYRKKGGEVLSITLSFLDTPGNHAVAEELKDQWAKIGVQVVLDAQSYDRISSETVPRRNFDALLFEIESTSDPDKYNLWHSTNIEYPGLNLPGYSFERVDILLERARTETDKAERAADYDLFQRYLMSDMPALYLFHPNYTFITHDSLQGVSLDDAILPHHRYNNVEEWHLIKRNVFENGALEDG